MYENAMSILKLGASLEGLLGLHANKLLYIYIYMYIYIHI